MQKILVINVNWLGDVLFSSPIFNALKKYYPSAHITCLAVPRVKDALECVNGIDDLMVYDEDGSHRSFFGKLKLISELRRKDFDAVFILHRSLTRALLAFFADIPIRAGYNTKGRGFFLTHKYQPQENTLHRSDYYLKIIESFGIPVSDRKTALNISLGDIHNAAKKLEAHGIKEGDPFVAMHIGGNWNLKQWPVSQFALLAEKLNKEGKKVVVIGSSSEKELVKELKASLSFPPVDLVGQTNFRELLGVLKKSNVLVSNDSGPLHVASSLGVSTIALFGPTRPEITGPRGTGKSVVLQKDVGCNRVACYFLECKNNVCMKAININDVFSSLQKF